MVGLLSVTGESVLPRLPSNGHCRFLQALLGVEERTLRNSRYGRRRRARARIRARGVWPITYDLSIGRMTVQRYGGGLGYVRFSRGGIRNAFSGQAYNDTQR